MVAFPTEIVKVEAREVFSERGHPGVEATVETLSGEKGVCLVTAGQSVGKHEVEFVYDGGPRWRGKGVQGAVDHVNEIIGPKIIGMDASKQNEVDAVILGANPERTKQQLGGNATAAVSGGVLQAGAAALGIPLYQHIGGVNAVVLPICGVGAAAGSKRYGGGERGFGKPSYTFYCYGFNSFAEAAYAGWDIGVAWREMLETKYNIPSFGDMISMIGPGVWKSDRELWALMTDTINRMGYEGKVGIQVDIAAGCYWEPSKNKFVGLLSAEDKTVDDLMRLYQDAVKQYPFVIIEDPLDEDDYDGHAALTRMLGIQIVGDDLFTTNLERVKLGISKGAANTVLLKVNQIGSISESFDMVRYAHRHGYGVMPCSSRGEGALIADYTVGLMTGQLREGATGPTGDRFLQIEKELGSRAQFWGKEALRP